MKCVRLLGQFVEELVDHQIEREIGRLSCLFVDIPNLGMVEP